MDEEDAKTLLDCINVFGPILQSEAGLTSMLPASSDLRPDPTSHVVVGGPNDHPEVCQPDNAWLAKYSFATEGVGLLTVAIVGICANFLSIAVLSHKEWPLIAIPSVELSE